MDPDEQAARYIVGGPPKGATEESEQDPEVRRQRARLWITEAVQLSMIDAEGATAEEARDAAQNDADMTATVLEQVPKGKAEGATPITPSKFPPYDGPLTPPGMPAVSKATQIAPETPADPSRAMPPLPPVPPPPVPKKRPR